MSLDNIKLPTQEIELRDGSKVMMQVQVKPTALEFVMAIAKKHPTWTITPETISRDYKHVEYNGRMCSEVDALWAYEFNVAQGKDVLGRIGAEYWGGQKFFITNDRIRKQRERGSITRTGDIKKAIKLVEKMFFPKTDAEVIKEITVRGKDLLGNYRYRKNSDFNDLWRNMSNSALSFVRDNLEEFRAYTSHSSITGLDRFEEIWDARDKARTLEDAYADGSASMVTIMGDTYFFTFKDTPIVSFTRDEVSPEIKTKVGMLKLVASGQAIDDVGFKCDDDVFVINMLPNIVRKGV